MKAARVHERGKIVIEDVPIPEVNEKEVLIAVHRVGICGTDVGVVDGHVSACYPVTLGHESSGVIAKLGSPSMTDFKEGDPVISGGGWGCGECELCRQGQGLYCRNRFSLGRNVDGCMAEYMKVDYRAVRKVPATVSLDEAQNTVNIACALRAVRKLDLRQVNTAAVFGPGNAGLIILQLLKMGGVEKVVMVGTRDFRLETARRFGADVVVNVKKEDPVKAILDRFPYGVDAVFESSGQAAALQSAFNVGQIQRFGRGLRHHLRQDQRVRSFLPVPERADHLRLKGGERHVRRGDETPGGEKAADPADDHAPLSPRRNGKGLQGV